MTGPSFAGYGPFEANLSWEERWSRVKILEQVCRGVPEAEPALRILRAGCHTEKRRSEALMILNGVPTRSLRGMLSKYHRLSTKKGEAA